MYIYISLQLQMVYMKSGYSSIDSALASNERDALAVVAVLFEVSSRPLLSSSPT